MSITTNTGFLKEALKFERDETARLDERLAFCEAILERIAQWPPALSSQQFIDGFIEIRLLAMSALEPRPPMKLHFTNDWLKKKIEEDPDDMPETVP